MGDLNSQIRGVFLNSYGPGHTKFTKSLMTHAGHRAYKKVDQRSPCDLLLLLRTNNKNYSDYEFAKEEEVTGQIKVC